MDIKTHFPFFRRIVSILTRRGARRSYLAVLLLLICLTAAARLRSYLMARKIQAVLHGLADIRVDRTTEEQLMRTVPCLRRSEQDWKVAGVVQHSRYTEVSNESDHLIPLLIGYGPDWLGSFAYWLGYRYIGFDARVLIQDGKVSQVEYGLARQWVRPRKLSYIVSAESVHGFWEPYQAGPRVTSQDDESPQYRVAQSEVPTMLGREMGLHVTFTNDAPPERTKRAFQLNLSCFWSLRACDDARGIAPGLWEDAQAIQTSTLQRLEAGKCPDSIIEGRMRYLPDLSVVLLEVTGSRRIEVNEEGGWAEDWFTDYKLKEVIRGRNFGSWKNVRFQSRIPSPGDRTQTIANRVWPQTKIGSPVLFFGTLFFDSCRFVPATPSALEIARKTPAPQKRPEDQIQRGLL